MKDCYIFLCEDRNGDTCYYAIDLGSGGMPYWSTDTNGAKYFKEKPTREFLDEEFSSCSYLKDAGGNTNYRICKVKYELVEEYNPYLKKYCIYGVGNKGGFGFIGQYVDLYTNKTNLKDVKKKFSDADSFWLQVIVESNSYENALIEGQKMIKSLSGK